MKSQPAYDREIRGMSQAQIEDLSNRKITFIFHPGRDMSEEDFKKRLNALTLNFLTDLYVEYIKDIPSLVSPFGIFNGRDQIVDSLNALQWIK